MPELITRLIMLILLVTLVWYVIKELIPNKYLTVLGGMAVVILLALIFQNPTDPFVGSVWGVLSLPFKPLGLSILLMAIALFKDKERVKKTDGNLVLWSFAILLFFSTPVVAYWLTNQAQQTAEQLTVLANNDQPVDVMAVLGDGVNPADPAYRGGTQFNRSDDGLGNAFVSRLQYTSQLFRAQEQIGRSPVVIVSPGPQLQQDEDALRTKIQTLLVQFGLPPGNILVETDGSDLHSSAVAMRTIIEDDLGLEERPYNLLLIGPALKIRRARSTFAKELGGLDNNIIPAPTDYYGFQAANDDLLARVGDIIPSVEALTLSTKVLDEYLGSIYYFMRGWLYDPLSL